MGSRFKGTKRQSRALNAFINLVRAAESTLSRTSVDLIANNLTVSQFGVMDALYHIGPMCQRDLGTKILKSSGNLTMVIDNLEKRSLVARKRNEEDRRFVTVHLTRSGTQLMRDILPGHIDLITSEMQSLAPDEQEQLRTLCRKLGKPGHG